MPDWNGMLPTIFSVASSMIQNCFGYEPMISVPLPAETRGGSAVWTGTRQTTRATASAPAILRTMVTASLREDEIDLAPVLLRRGALAGPVRRVIELVGHLRRPVAADVTVEQIAFDRLAQPGGAAGAIRFPARREHQRAADRKVRQLRHPGPLQRDDVLIGGALDARRLAVDGFQVIHDTSSLAGCSSNCVRKAGFRAASSPYTWRHTSVQPRIQSQ